MGKKAPVTPGWVGNRGVLALLEDRPGLLVAEIAKKFGLSASTVAHHLARLRVWGQVVGEPEYLKVVIPSPHGPVKGKVRRLRWSATDRGLARLEFCRKRDRRKG
jgi:DNA-binding transcriptional ArsR family regulator